MSRYTTELRFIVEKALKEKGLSNEEYNWKQIYDVLGIGDYPIFDTGYRESLNNKIIRHYYMREICAETAERWKLFMRDTMFLIMPYYNQLYESEVLAKNMEPLGDRNMKRSEHAWGTSSSNGASSGNAQSVYNDTPSSEMIPQQIKNMQYATAVNLDENAAESNASGNYDNMMEKTESGYSSSQASLLLLYRKTFLNIDRSVVEDVELSQCFMTIW